MQRRKLQIVKLRFPPQPVVVTISSMDFLATPTKTWMTCSKVRFVLLRTRLMNSSGVGVQMTRLNRCTRLKNIYTAWQL
jgi:hypothetical protein